MRNFAFVVCALSCMASTAPAQGRGGRQGGPGGPMPSGPMCYNRGDAAVQTTNRTVNVNGVDMMTQTVVLSGKPGVKELLNPCPAGFGGGDPFASYFFSPELIMAHQQAIALSDAQRTGVRTLMLEAQKSFVPVQFKVASEVESLQRLVSAPSVDEGAVIEQVDRVLALEREIKHEQIALMVRLKNLLTQSQQETLASLRQRE